MHVFLHHLILWNDRCIEAASERQVKRIKILAEMFKYPRLSKTLNYVEVVFFLDFTWLPDRGYLGGSGNRPQYIK